MKTEDPDKKLSFWECPNCKKEHKIKTLFCDGCGEPRPEKEKIKIILRNKISDNQSYSNIKKVDWFIMICAFCLPIFIFSLFLLILVANLSENIWIYFFGLLILLSLVLIIYALRRLYICKSIFLWQRVLVLWVTILFNPITIFIIFMFVALCFGPRGCMSKTRRTNKSKFSKACSEIVLNKNLYNSEYSKDFSDLPGFIKDTKPVYVWINENHIKIAISKRPSYGWKFSQNTNGIWSLYSYFENELKYPLYNSLF